jgi:hypothetical protein
MNPTNEPLSNSGELVAASLALNPGCCGNDEWRGRLCQYHSGYRDGADAALDWLKNGPDDAE